MICQKCGKRSATVHLKQITNGIAHEEYLCSLCANTKNTIFNPETELNAASLFEALFSSGRQAVNETTCSLCGATAYDIQKSGKAGCAKCYDVFRRELKTAAYKIHGGVKHVGNAPEKNRAEIERQAKIEELKEHQAKAIEEQNFELAAKLRDEIKALSDTDIKTSNDGKERG